MSTAVEGLGLAGVLWLLENLGSHSHLNLAGGTKLSCLGISVPLQQ